MFERILFFGFGTMASAMLKGWIASGMAPSRFTIYNPRSKAVPAGAAFTDRIPNASFDLVILGIKPQKLAEVANEVEPLLGSDTVLVSILAGVDLASLGELFPRAGGIVRLMPNLAVALRQSPNALVASRVSDDTRAAVSDLATRLGSAEWLPDETQFDLVTALAGSGPGFVYRFIDALASGATSLGLDAGRAERLAVQMVAGAGALAAASDHSPGDLASQVASPGGMTQKGLDVLDEGKALEALVTRCLAAARDRGLEMGRQAREQ